MGEVRITDEMVEAARAKGRELAGNQPGALVEAMAEIAEQGARAALSAALSGLAEPVAWRWKHPSEPAWKFSLNHPGWDSTSPYIVEPLYPTPAKPPRPHPVLGRAALAVLKSWDERVGHEKEALRKSSQDGHEYWSPASSMVSSDAMAALRAALAQEGK